MQVIIPVESVSPIEKVERFAAGQVESWLEASDQFLKWERANMLLAEPSPELAQQHRRVLTLLLGFLRVMYQEGCAAALDQRTMAGLSLRVRKLEGSWNMFYSPSPQAEAQDIRQQCFPG